MAGGIDWFRWHHGSVTDPKFQLVARKSGASLPDVLAVWAYLLETSSASIERGTFAAIDCEAWDCLFNFPSTETRTADILRAMQQRELIGDGVVISWEKRQPKREREPAETSTARVQSHRAMKRHETPTEATDGAETPREEKRREEIQTERGQHRAPAREPDPKGHDPTPAGLACRAIKSAGIADVNPGHAGLLRLLDAGVTAAELGATAVELAGKGKAKFALLLATVDGRRRDAASAGAVPEPPKYAVDTAVLRTAELLAEQAKHAAASVPPPASILGLAQRMKRGIQ